MLTVSSSCSMHDGISRNIQSHTLAYSNNNTDAAPFGDPSSYQTQASTASWLTCTAFRNASGMCHVDSTSKHMIGQALMQLCDADNLQIP